MNTNSDNLYYLIWLDINANNDELTKTELQSATTCQLLTFDHVNTCEQYVSNNPDARFIFIVSYELGFIIAPKIVSLKQTIIVFVYSKNTIRDTYGLWTDKYLTVRTACELPLLRQKKFVFLFSESSTSYNRSNKTKNCSSI